MDGTSAIFDICIIYYRTYVGVCVTPFFFFFGVRCAQYKVHAQCSFAALAPHMPCMLLVHLYVYFSPSHKNTYYPLGDCHTGHSQALQKGDELISASSSGKCHDQKKLKCE